MLRANPGTKLNSLLARLNLRRFRRLFAAAQSTELSKLPNPLTNIRFFSCDMRVPVDPPATSGFAGDDRRNYDERLRHRPVVGNAEVNARLIALRRQDLKPGQRPAAQLHGRTAARQVQHPHIAPPDATPDAGAERLRTSLLGGESLRVGCDHHLLVLGATPGLGALGFREDAIEEPITMALDDLRDPADVDQVRANADDHALLARFGPPAEFTGFLRPRSIAARIVRTVSPRPTNSACPTMS